MGRSRLIAAAMTTVAVGGFTAAPALAAAQPWTASVNLMPSSATPGGTISFSGQAVADGSGTCVVRFDRVLLNAECVWDVAGRISGVFEIPADAAIGTSAAVSVCSPDCYDGADDAVPPPRYWQANTSLEILASVNVPDVTCLPEDVATTRLGAAGFKVDVDRELGDVVTVQQPVPGTPLKQTEPVVLLLHGAVVPDLVGSTYQGARLTLAKRCLEISAFAGITDGTVELQKPNVEALVPGGTTVSVTMSGPTPSPTPPTATASPAPSTPAATEAGPNPGSDSDPVSSPIPATALMLALLVALLIGLLLVSGVLARMIRRYRGAGWVTAHITVTPRPGPDATFTISPDNVGDRDHIITVVPEEVERSTTIEESPA